MRTSDLYHDLSTFPDPDPEPVSVGETLADVAKAICLMLVIIAFGFDMIGFFS